MNFIKKKIKHHKKGHEKDDDDFDIIPCSQPSQEGSGDGEKSQRNTEEWQFFQQLTERVQDTVQKSQTTLSKLKDTSAISTLNKNEFSDSDDEGRQLPSTSQSWVHFEDDGFNSPAGLAEKESKPPPRPPPPKASSGLDSDNTINSSLLIDGVSALSLTQQTFEAAVQNQTTELDLLEEFGFGAETSQTINQTNLSNFLVEEEEDEGPDPFDTSFVDAATVLYQNDQTGVVKPVTHSKKEELDPFDISFLKANEDAIISSSKADDLDLFNKLDFKSEDSVTHLKNSINTESDLFDAFLGTESSIVSDLHSFGQTDLFGLSSEAESRTTVSLDPVKTETDALEISFLESSTSAEILENGVRGVPLLKTEHKITTSEPTDSSEPDPFDTSFVDNLHDFKLNGVFEDDKSLQKLPLEDDSCDLTSAPSVPQPPSTDLEDLTHKRSSFDTDKDQAKENEVLSDSDSMSNPFLTGSGSLSGIQNNLFDLDNGSDIGKDFFNIPSSTKKSTNPFASSNSVEQTDTVEGNFLDLIDSKPKDISADLDPFGLNAESLGSKITDTPPGPSSTGFDFFSSESNIMPTEKQEAKVDLFGDDTLTTETPNATDPFAVDLNKDISSDPFAVTQSIKPDMPTLISERGQESLISQNSSFLDMNDVAPSQYKSSEIAEQNIIQDTYGRKASSALEEIDFFGTSGSTDVLQSDIVNDNVKNVVNNQISSDPFGDFFEVDSKDQNNSQLPPQAVEMLQPFEINDTQEPVNIVEAFHTKDTQVSTDALKSLNGKEIQSLDSAFDIEPVAEVPSDVNNVPVMNAFEKSDAFDSSGPFEPSSAFDSSAPFEPSSAFDSSAPLEPSNAFDSSGPFEPSSAFDSSGPLEPSNAFDSSGPPEPSSAFDSSGLLEPSNAFDSSGPFEPSSAFDSSGPLEPSNAFDSSGPFEPSNAFDSSGPFEPSNAFDSSGPFEPSNAFDSSGPFEPGNAFDSSGPFESSDAFSSEKHDPFSTGKPDALSSEKFDILSSEKNEAFSSETHDPFSSKIQDPFSSEKLVSAPNEKLNQFSSEKLDPFASLLSDKPSQNAEADKSSRHDAFDEFDTFGSVTDTKNDNSGTIDDPFDTSKVNFEPIKDSLPYTDTAAFEAFAAKFEEVIEKIEDNNAPVDIFDPFGAPSFNQVTDMTEGFGTIDAFDPFLSMTRPPENTPTNIPKPTSQDSFDEDDNLDFSVVIKPKMKDKTDSLQPSLAPPPLLPPPPKTPTKSPGTKFNPFDPGMEASEGNDDDDDEWPTIDLKPEEPPEKVLPPALGEAGVTRTDSQESPSTPLFDEDTSQPLEVFPKDYEGDGWEMMLRQPNKKKITGNRFWKKVFVRYSENHAIQLFNKKEDNDPFQELPLQACYSLSELGAQQYDAYGKIFTVKLQYIFYRERVGVRPGQLTKVMQGQITSMGQIAKLGLPLEHAPQISQLLKLGTQTYQDLKMFVQVIEDALFRLTIHRDRALTYKTEEIQVTVQDEYYVEQNTCGIIEKQLARVRIFFLAFISGMPDIEVGVNDLTRQGREVVGRYDILPIVTEEWIRLENCEFHCCVQKDDFEKDRVIKLHPPDACHFELLRFRIRPPKNRELPLKVKANMMVNKTNVEIRADVLVPGYHSRKHGQVPCENIQIKFAIPECWIYLFRVEKHFRYGSLKSAARKPGKIKGLERIMGAAQSLDPSLIEVSCGQAKYEHAMKAVVWRIPRLPKEGQGAYTTHLFLLRLDLTSFDKIPDSFSNIIDVEFTMPHTTVSHTTVRSISVSGGNPPEKYVRYISKHEYKVELEFANAPEENVYVVATKTDTPADRKTSVTEVAENDDFDDDSD